MVSVYSAYNIYLHFVIKKYNTIVGIYSLVIRFKIITKIKSELIIYLVTGIILKMK